MKRFFNGEIALGFALGVATFLAVAVILSIAGLHVPNDSASAGLEYWLNRYQTLVGDLFLFLAAAATGLPLYGQFREARRAAAAPRYEILRRVEGNATDRATRIAELCDLSLSMFEAGEITIRQAPLNSNEFLIVLSRWQAMAEKMPGYRLAIDLEPTSPTRELELYFTAVLRRYDFLFEQFFSADARPDLGEPNSQNRRHIIGRFEKTHSLVKSAGEVAWMKVKTEAERLRIEISGAERELGVISRDSTRYPPSA